MFQIWDGSRVKNQTLTATWPDMDENDNRLRNSYKLKYDTLCDPPEKLYDPLPKNINWNTAEISSVNSPHWWRLVAQNTWPGVQQDTSKTQLLNSKTHPFKSVEIGNQTMTGILIGFADAGLHNSGKPMHTVPYKSKNVLNSRKKMWKLWLNCKPFLNDYISQ